MAARRRWAWAAATLAGAVLVALAAGGDRGAAEDRERLDVVLIMTDDQTVESLRVMPRTRELLAEPGTTFANSFASYPLCCPSRATLLTGQYAHNNGVLGNRPPQGGYEKLRPTAGRTLPAWLARAGYDTVHIGKYLNGYGAATPAGEVPPGWTDWHGSVDPTTYRMWGYRLNENGVVRQYGRPRVENPALYQTDVYRDKAVAAIRSRARSAQPLFLSVAFLAPHAEAGAPRARPTVRSAPRHRGRLATEPLPRPASFDEADISDKPAALGRAFGRLSPQQVAQIGRAYRGRLESLLAVDEAVAAIVRAARDGPARRDARRLHLRQRLLPRRASGSQRQVPGLRAVRRVPLIVRGPGIDGGGRRGARGQRRPGRHDPRRGGRRGRRGRTLDGRSLLAFARRPSRRSDPAILLETAQTVDSGDLDQDGGPGVTRPALQRIPTYRAVRTERFKYVEHSTGERELYDLRRDPDELRSVHADPDYARTLAALRRELVRLRRCKRQRVPPRGQADPRAALGGGARVGSGVRRRSSSAR